MDSIPTTTYDIAPINEANEIEYLAQGYKHIGGWNSKSSDPKSFPVPLDQTYLLIGETFDKISCIQFYKSLWLVIKGTLQIFFDFKMQILAASKL